MSNQPSTNIWHIFFALLGVATLVAFGIAIWQDTYPEWITYQRAYYREKYEDAKTRYEQAGNEKERARWRKRLTAFKNPEYEIKQILLGNGTDVDRCITCHLDESSLKKAHPRSKEFPFQKFGCTACHGGDGRATTIKKAHVGIGMDKKAKWEKIAPLLEEGLGKKTLREEAAYVGSQDCIDCHEDINEEYIRVWRDSPMATMAYLRIKDDPDKEKCYSCHTTGYNLETKAFVERNIGCEACHGPGEKYVAMMMRGEAEKGGEIAMENAKKSCGKCHNPHIPTEIHAELARRK
jgi:hypothetical protein